MLPDKPKYASRSHAFLKGEAFIAALLAGGFSFDRLILERTGSFTKSYHKDIEDVKHTTDSQDNPVLRIRINRDSIYDRLPEGLFHQPRATGAATAGVGQMITEYRRFREEEKAARRFFQPLEQEFFRYASLVEQEEQEMSWGLLSGQLNNTFSRFWNLQEGLPAGPASVLVRIMPWAHLIKGDRALCAKALEMMLGTPVSAVQQMVQEHRREDAAFTLGQGTLGVDSVAGSTFEEAAVSWVFTIGGLESAAIPQFLEAQPYGKLLQQFSDIFIPVEVEAVFRYELASSKEEEAPVLGYSLTL